MNQSVKTKILRAQEAIYRHTGMWLFREDAALFLFELGVLTEEEYEQVVNLFAKKV